MVQPAFNMVCSIEGNIAQHNICFYYLGLSVGGGFLAGILIGYALKKVVRLVAIAIGLFLTELACLQYQQIITINWDKIPNVTQTFEQIKPTLNLASHPEFYNVQGQ